MSETREVYAESDLVNGGETFRTMKPPALFAVFGDPVAHSASPPMHNAALKDRGIDAQYVRIRVTPENLQSALRNLMPSGFLGVSLTIPHKQAALPLMDAVSHEARLMGAINTVVVRDGKLQGFNTDGPGLSAAIEEEFGVPLKDLRVLILGGAGGAGRAITVQCALEGCPSITIANRNPEKGESLSAEIRESLGNEVSSISLHPEDLHATLSSVDLIINATPLGMKSGDSSPLPHLAEGLLNARHLIYDTVYSGGETALLRDSRGVGARSANGFSMLLHQGALQNALWLGEPAPVEKMRIALAELKS
jgi:shikimate dehydrogenase